MQKITWLEIEPATISGAVRTALMRQNGINPADYCKSPEKRHGRKFANCLFV